MAQLQAPFNAQQFDPTQSAGFKPLMLGKYPCVIVASEVKANKDASTGGQLVFEIQAIDGPDSGKSGQWVINLYHTDDQTRSIAERTLSAICHATGQFLITDTQQLHNKPFALDVTEQALTQKQQADKDAGKNVTPFRNARVLMPDGSEVTAGGYSQQQHAPAQQGAWGGAAPAQQPTQAPAAPAPAPAAAWGGAAPAAQPAQAPAAAPAAAWGQQAASGGAPAWGKR